MKGQVLEKGTVSNSISFFTLTVGLVATMVSAEGLLHHLGPWLLAAGLFGFAGGITNWLAVKMLFDRVPLLYGSGVVPGRFREIRETIKDLIMTHFFDEQYLRRFFAEGEGLFPTSDLEEKLLALLKSDQADTAIAAQLEKLRAGPFGMFIGIAGVDVLKPMVQQFLEGLAVDLAPTLKEQLESEMFDVSALREQVDGLLDKKLEELTPEVVKQMVEQVIREHLGWLIVWGNVFGGAIGLLSRGIASQIGIRGVP